MIQEKMVGDLLYHLDTNGSVGLEGIPVALLRELLQVLTEPLPSLTSSPGPWGGARALEGSQWDAHLQEGLEGGPGEPQACQSNPGAGECHGAARCGVPSDSTGQPGASPASTGLGRSCLTNPISFSNPVICCLVDEGNMDVSVCTSVKPLASFSTASSRRNWLLTAWISECCLLGKKLADGSRSGEWSFIDGLSICQ